MRDLPVGRGRDELGGRRDDLRPDCLAHPTVIGLWEQPAAEPYVDKDGVAHLHTFDFIAIQPDKTRTAVMIRPEDSAERRHLKELVDGFAEKASQRVNKRRSLTLLRDETYRLRDQRFWLFGWGQDRRRP